MQWPRPKHARKVNSKHGACKATKGALHYTYQNRTWYDLRNRIQSYGMLEQDQKHIEMAS